MRRRGFQREVPVSGGCSLALVSVLVAAEGLRGVEVAGAVLAVEKAGGGVGVRRWTDRVFPGWLRAVGLVVKEVVDGWICHF